MQTGIERAKITEAEKELRRALATDGGKVLLEYTATFARTVKAARQAHGLFKRWSPRNMRWLTLQANMLGEPHVGLYAGPAQWATMGRAVRDDATPKLIWVPATAVQDEDGDSGGDEKPQRRRTYFITQKVFDWGDTFAEDGSPDPDWEQPLTAGDQRTLDGLIAASPVAVRVRSDLTGHPAHGWLSRDGITLDGNRPLGNQITTLLHELAHHYYGHLEGVTERAVAEQEADLAAWVAAVALDLDTDGAATANAASYLASWRNKQGAAVGGHKGRLRLLDEKVEEAVGVAEQILEEFLPAEAGLSAAAQPARSPV